MPILHLDEKAIENMKSHKHITNGLTVLETYLFDPFWRGVTHCLPRSVLPNFLTSIGVVFPLLQLIYLCYLSPSMQSELPYTYYILAVFAIFWY